MVTVVMETRAAQVEMVAMEVMATRTALAAQAEMKVAMAVTAAAEGLVAAEVLAGQVVPAVTEGPLIPVAAVARAGRVELAERAAMAGPEAREAPERPAAWVVPAVLARLECLQDCPVRTGLPVLVTVLATTSPICPGGLPFACMICSASFTGRMCG